MVSILNLLSQWMHVGEFMLVYVYLNSNIFFFFLTQFVPFAIKKICYLLYDACNCL